MPRQRAISTTSTGTDRDAGGNDGGGGQEMGSMYDYLAKIILLGPSGCGKSCLLHRFVKGDWRVLSSQTIGVEFASKIVKVGVQGQRRKRVKLQLWDTAGTERFRSVSRSYYRGAAGAILVYDLGDARSFAQLGTFLNDVRVLGSQQVAVVLCGNKSDLLEEPGRQQSLLDENDIEPGSLSSRTGSIGPSLGSQQRATLATGTGRALSASTISQWATQNNIPASMEVSALSGEGVDEVFNKLARTILTKIELGEIDPDDPMSGIQYGDADYYRFDDGGSSIKSGGLTSDGYGGGSMRRRRRKGGWSDVFRLGRSGSTSTGGGNGKCC